jgi:hypothetical protein
MTTRSATAALQYSSRDVTVDRVSGRVIEGNAWIPGPLTLRRCQPPCFSKNASAESARKSSSAERNFA